MNQKSKKSQILLLSLLAALLVITPFLSSSLRPTYLYFIFNFIIIGLAVEAGLLSVLSKPLEDKRPAAVSVVAVVSAPEASHEAKASALEFGEKTKATTKVLEKSSSDRVVGSANEVDKEVKKGPSMSSLFFVGGVDSEAEEVAAAEEVDFEVEEDEEEVMVPSGQELFAKAEIFIGDFYKQLKMQREESWNKIHGFYQKAF